MAITVINAGTNPDGSTHWHYHAPGAHLLFTGDSSGPVQLADGSTYDVTPAVIEVASPEHAAELADRIGEQ